MHVKFKAARHSSKKRNSFYTIAYNNEGHYIRVGWTACTSNEVTYLIKKGRVLDWNRAKRHVVPRKVK